MSEEAITMCGALVLLISMNFNKYKIRKGGNEDSRELIIIGVCKNRSCLLDTVVLFGGTGDEGKSLIYFYPRIAGNNRMPFASTQPWL